MNQSNVSAIEKAFKVIAYVVVSGGLAALGTYLSSHPELVGGVMVSTLVIAAINSSIVFIKGALDPNTPTLPH